MGSVVLGKCIGSVVITGAARDAAARVLVG